MRRFFERPRALIRAGDEWAEWEESEISRDILDMDPEPTDTGLVDQFGEPIHRPVERVTFGFCK